MRPLSGAGSGFGVRGLGYGCGGKATGERLEQDTRQDAHLEGVHAAALGNVQSLGGEAGVTGALHTGQHAQQIIRWRRRENCTRRCVCVYVYV